MVANAASSTSASTRSSVASTTAWSARRVTCRAGSTGAAGCRGSGGPAPPRRDPFDRASAAMATKASWAVSGRAAARPVRCLARRNDPAPGGEGLGHDRGVGEPLGQSTSLRALPVRSPHSPAIHEAASRLRPPGAGHETSAATTAPTTSRRWVQVAGSATPSARLWSSQPSINRRAGPEGSSGGRAPPARSRR